MSSVAPTAERPISFTLATTGFRAGSRRRIAAIDLTNLLDQPGIVVGNADHLGAMTGRGRAPRHLLEQPGPERVELAHPGHIHLDGLRPIELRRDGVGERLEGRHIGRGPGPAWTQLKHIA